MANIKLVVYTSFVKHVLKKLGKVGAFEAKTHLSEILSKVEDGGEIIITKRGRSVAKIVPFSEEQSKRNKDEILNDFSVIRKKTKEKTNIKSFIEEGRKY